MPQREIDDLQGPLHFIGVGGYGMSGLAYVLAAQGATVTGCDAKESPRLQRLRSAGISVCVGHDAGHLRGAGAVVYSTDVPDDNPEIERAREMNLPVLHRSHVLAHLMHRYDYSIAVTGTHGKTTTVAMTGEMLESAGLSPTVLVGGELVGSGFTARVGSSPYLVAEACESDGSFLRYRPRYIIATNLEPEHLEFYGGSFDNMVEVFAQFLSNAQPEGAVVVSADDPQLRSLARDVPGEVITCSVDDAEADYRAVDITLRAGASAFTLVERESVVHRCRVPAPGLHMVKNALQVAALARRMGLSGETIARGLAGYRGVGRRFQCVGEREGVLIIDDYAHHPTEIAATLRAARGLAERRVIAVFQPQRHTRTRALMDEFTRCFDRADELVLTPIYRPAGQKKIPGVSSDALAERIRARGNLTVSVMKEYDEIVQYLYETAEPGDLVLTMGAGDIWRVAEELAE